MPRDFDGSTTRLNTAIAATIVQPVTLAAWINPDSTTADQAVFGLRNGNNRHYFRLFTGGGQGGDPILFQVSDNNNPVTAATTSGFSGSTWHHIAGVSAGATDHRVFIDGGSKGTNTTSRSPGSTNTVDVAAIGASPVFDGRIAWVCIWDVALSDAEIAVLGKGVDPRLIRPASLKECWPVWGYHSPEIAIVSSGTNIPITGSPAVHASAPRVRLWKGGRINSTPAGQIFTGTGALTLSGATVSASGTQEIPGSAVLALTAASIAASGLEEIPGSAALALAVAAINASGTHAEAVSGTGVLNLAAAVLAATGVHTENVTGTGALTFTKAALAASGAEELIGSAALSLPILQVAASGLLEIPGTATLALSAVTLAATGAEEMAATAAMDLFQVILNASGTHQEPVTSTGALTLAAVVLTTVAADTGLPSSVIPGIISNLVRGLVSNLAKNPMRES